jgi:hypothetical protein
MLSKGHLADDSIDRDLSLLLERLDGRLGRCPEDTVDGAGIVAERLQGFLQVPHCRIVRAFPQNRFSHRTPPFCKSSFGGPRADGARHDGPPATADGSPDGDGAPKPNSTQPAGAASNASDARAYDSTALSGRHRHRRIRRPVGRTQYYRRRWCSERSSAGPGRLAPSGRVSDSRKINK